MLRAYVISIALSLAAAACSDSTKRKVNEPCANSSDCADSVCHAGICASSSPLTNGASCEGRGQCRSFTCVDGRCAAGANPSGTVCLHGEECAGQVCTTGLCGGTTPADGGPSRNDAGVTSYLPKDGDVPGWVENPDEGKPGIEAGNTATEIEAIIDGVHDPYRAAGCNGFAKQDYKKGTGKCAAGACAPGTYALTAMLWDMKDAPAAKAMFDKNRKDGEANGLTFESVPNAPSEAVLARDDPFWRVFGHKSHYVFKIIATAAPGESNTLKPEVIVFVSALAARLP